MQDVDGGAEDAGIDEVLFDRPQGFGQFFVVRGWICHVVSQAGELAKAVQARSTGPGLPRVYPLWVRRVRLQVCTPDAEGADCSLSLRSGSGLAPDHA